MLLTHPAYERVKKGDGLFYDPISKGPSQQNLWDLGESEAGADRGAHDLLAAGAGGGDARRAR